MFQGEADWLGDDDSPLEGFTWRGGSDRDTTGILLWSEAFICQRRNGEEVCKSIKHFENSDLA